jgi:hypothetical protein
MDSMGGGDVIPESRDVPRPSWGPAFLSFDSWPYRLEYAVGTVAILLLVLGWRGLVLHEFPTADLLLFVLFLLLPDLVAFVPMSLSRPPKGSWPSWGPPLYNGMHSLLVWAGAFLVAWVLTGGIFWPLLGWAAHITLDRAVGYHLRARVPKVSTSPPTGVT